MLALLSPLVRDYFVGREPPSCTNSSNWCLSHIFFLFCVSDGPTVLRIYLCSHLGCCCQVCRPLIRYNESARTNPHFRISLNKVRCFLSLTRAAIACPPGPLSMQPKYQICVPFFGFPRWCFCFTQHVSSISIILSTPPILFLTWRHSVRQKLNQLTTECSVIGSSSFTAFLFLKSSTHM